MQQPPLSSPHHHSSPMQPPLQPSPMMPPPMQPMMMQMATVPEGPRWRALRIVAGMLKVFAWIELVFGLLSALATTLGMFGMIGMIGGSRSSSDGAVALLGGALMFLLIALVVGIFFLFLYSISELILLMIAIENNTRPRRS